MANRTPRRVPTTRDAILDALTHKPLTLQEVWCWVPRTGNARRTLQRLLAEREVVVEKTFGEPARLRVRSQKKRGTVYQGPCPSCYTPLVLRDFEEKCPSCRLPWTQLYLMTDIEMRLRFGDNWEETLARLEEESDAYSARP